MIKPTTYPIWQHDCDSCTYHGTFEGYDVYTCNDKECNNTPWNLISIIARYGNEGSEYYSTHLPFLFDGEVYSKPQSAIHKALQTTKYQYYIMAQEIHELTFMSDRMRDLFRLFHHLENPDLEQERRDEINNKAKVRMYYLEELYYYRKGL